MSLHRFCVTLSNVDCRGVDYKFYLPAMLATSNAMLLQKTTNVARSFSDAACSAWSTYVSMQMLGHRFCFEFGLRVTHQNTKHRTPRDQTTLKLPINPLLLQIQFFQSQAKFSPERAKECVDWIEEVANIFFLNRLQFQLLHKLPFSTHFAWCKRCCCLQVLGSKLEMEVKDQVDFGTVLKDGAVLCQSVSPLLSPLTSPFASSYPLKRLVPQFHYINFRLINAISPGSVKKINTMKAPFKQRENIEMYLKACAAYGLKEQDLFQVLIIISLSLKKKADQKRKSLLLLNF